MKTFFIFLMVSFLCGYAWSNTSAKTDVKKAVLSYSLPSKLDWKQSTEDDLGKDTQLFTLGEESAAIRLMSNQIGNEQLWNKYSTMDKEGIYKELVEGKKLVHNVMGYKDWKAEKSLQKKSDKEIVFEINGSFMQGAEKNFFVEKYYLTPYGFILISLDWSEKADQKLAKQAQNEFNNITFKSETK